METAFRGATLNALTTWNDSPLQGILCLLNDSISSCRPRPPGSQPLNKPSSLAESLNMPQVDAAYYIYDCLHPRAPALVLPE